MLPHLRHTAIYILYLSGSNFRCCRYPQILKIVISVYIFILSFFLVFIPINPLHAVGTFIHQDRFNSTPIICFLTVNCLKQLLFSINPLRAESFQLQF